MGIACRFGFVVESRPVEAVVRRDQLGQRAEIGVQELRVLAPFLDHRDDLVLASDRAEHA